MPRIALLLFFFIFSICPNFAQTYLKANALTALVLIPNVGVETSISNKFTFQTDVAMSFWKSIGGSPYEFIIVIPEIRYHFKEKYNGFYAGFNIGGGTFKLRKWDHPNNQYQEGYNFLIGFTIGYEKKISQKIMLDIFLGGGDQQGYYKGYDKDTHIRYDDADKLNKSGEIIPYRGGVMISYKL